MKEQQTIYPRQLMFIIFGVLLNTSLLSVPAMAAQSAGRDAWLSLILTAIVPLISYLIIRRQMILRPDQGLSGMYRELFGPAVSKVLIVVFCLYCIVIASVFTVYISEIVSTFFLPHTSSLIIIGLLLICSGYIIFSGIRFIGRAHEIAFWLLIGFIVLVFAFLPPGDVTNLMPFGEGGISHIVDGARTLVLPMLGFELVQVFHQKCTKKKKARRILPLALVLSTLIYSGFTALCLYVFGPEFIDKILWPVAALYKITLNPFAQYINLLFVILWIVFGLRPVTSYLYAAKDSFYTAMGLKTTSNGLICTGFAVVTFIVSVMIRRLQVLDEMLYVVRYGFLLFALLLPLILVIAFSVKKGGHPMKRKSIIAALLLILSMLLSGCKDIHDIDALSFPLVIRVDQADKSQVETSILFPKIKSTTAEGTGGDEKPPIILTTKAKTIDSALGQNAGKVQGELYYGLLQAIIIGKDLGKDGLSPYLDTFIRNPSIKMSLPVILTENKSSDIFEVAQEEDAAAFTKKITSTLANAHATGFFPQLSMYDFMIHAQTSYRNPILPVFSVITKEGGSAQDSAGGGGGAALTAAQADGSSQETGEQKDFIYDGIALFEGDRVATILRGNEVMPLCVLRGEASTGSLPFEYGGKAAGTVQFEHARKISLGGDMEKPVFQIHIDLNGTLTESYPDVPASDRSIHIIEQSIEKQVTDACEQLLAKMQNDLRFDCIDVFKYLRAKYGDKAFSGGPKQVLQNSTFQLDVNLRIRNVGEKE